MFRFEHPEFLYLLILVPVLAFASLLIGQRQKRALERFGNPELLQPLMPSASAVRPVIKFYLMLLAFTAILFTLAGPQFGTKLETVKRKGIEIIYPTIFHISDSGRICRNVPISIIYNQRIANLIPRM